jgi:hypothetical protein
VPDLKKEDLIMFHNFRPGIDDRCRDANGEIRHKNGATRVGSLREAYGENFAQT